MDPLMIALEPIAAMGNDVSASVYKIPSSVKGEVVGGIIAQEPRLKSLMGSGQAKVNGIQMAGGEGLIAIGGFIEPAVFEKVHEGMMSMSGVELIVGMGSGCRTLPPTALGMAAAGAHGRAQAAAKKPWWKFW